jgi:hypothetical protein
MKKLSDALPQSQPARPGDSVRRLQIGIGGVLVILLLVGLAGIIGKRAGDQAAVEAGATTTAVTDVVASDQPLVDLGVQPANPDPVVAAPAPMQPGTVVPDLPDAAAPVTPAPKSGQ